MIGTSGVVSALLWPIIRDSCSHTTSKSIGLGKCPLGCGNPTLVFVCVGVMVNEVRENAMKELYTKPKTDKGKGFRISEYVICGWSLEMPFLCCKYELPNGMD